jgi:hypothetical protein
MRYFDEVDPYWGNISKPIINAGNGRLNVRSVKIFADGKKTICVPNTSVHVTWLCRCFEVGWGSSE